MPERTASYQIPPAAKHPLRPHDDAEKEQRPGRIEQIRLDDLRADQRITIQRTGDVSHALRDLAKRYQVVIVDAGGRDSRELRTAMLVADLLLTPIRASQADLETLPAVNDLVRLAKDFNPSLAAHAVLSMAPTNPVIREIEDARQLLADFDQLPLANSIIRDRKVFRDAMLAGKGVVELDNGTARAEIQLLAQEFFDLSA